MGEHVRTVWRERIIVDNDEAFASHSILSGRARQVIRLHGYRIGVSAGWASPVTSDTLDYLVALQAIDRNWGLNPDQFMGGTQQAQIAKQTLIDLYWSSNITLTGSLGITVFNSEWVPCNLLLPEIAVYKAVDGSDASGYTSWVVLEYEWVDASPGEIAAVNLVWGRDPNDFDRS